MSGNHFTYSRTFNFTLFHAFFLPSKVSFILYFVFPYCSAHKKAFKALLFKTLDGIYDISWKIPLFQHFFQQAHSMEDKKEGLKKLNHNFCARLSLALVRSQFMTLKTSNKMRKNVFACWHCQVLLLLIYVSYTLGAFLVNWN